MGLLPNAEQTSFQQFHVVGTDPSDRKVLAGDPISSLLYVIDLRQIS